MTLLEQLSEDVKDAMRAGENLRRDTLRMVLAAMKNRRIEVGEDLDGDQQLAVLLSAVKSRTDSVTQYEANGRQDLADQERAEIEVIQGYLPKQLGEEETAEVVRTKIAELGLTSKKEMGQLMKAIMADHKGTVDGKLVQQVAAQELD
ncbi:MAG TPA: GatB/YqeY domain-containing protein [Planctomycetes bacterium]|nr:GatB/YqeY domain-containing protein [Planctomycetota bacterium]HIK60787.1 GatB/YqeY domain-containing protein [Planctomycetota bacterium]